ncbi:MAG TPA: hypothetical protein VMM18_16940 [Gemmatimonadaceae bacterium]|nr:hypothetical protein [Gemmatimonadaceae bacterium]
MHHIRLIAVLCFATLAPAAAAAQIDQQRASAYFREAAAACEREGSRLWGVSLCTPMVFADPVTGSIATNRPAPDAPRPRALGYANAAMEWGGVRWATFVWPMIPADDERARVRLMLHESFHVVQPEFGLYIATTAGENDHLDTPEGRYWMQLEWRALASALATSGVARTEAIRDALTFRRARHAAFPDAAVKERPSEINEGLPEYTATVTAAASRAEAVADAIDQLARAPDKDSFVRTFAYPSGTAYGILLDASAPGWTRRIGRGDDLAALLMVAAGVRPADDVRAAAERHGGSALRIAEETRETERQAQVVELRRRFVDGPVLVLPRGRNASFITTGVTPIPGAGTIYPRFRVSGEWGSIEADQVLMSTDGSTLRVPAPDTVWGTTLSGDGWTVTLSPGWSAHPGPRAGDFQVLRDPGSPGLQ